GTTSARPPSASMPSATPTSACSSRAASMTVAPRSANTLAMVAPIPRLAPVTIATLPASERPFPSVRCGTSAFTSCPSAELTRTDVPSDDGEPVPESRVELGSIDLRTRPDERHERCQPRIRRHHPAKQRLDLVRITNELGSSLHVASAQAHPDRLAVSEIELPSPSARSEQDAAVLHIADGLAIVPSGLPTRVEQQHQPSTDGRIHRQREEPADRDVRAADQKSSA